MQDNEMVDFCGELKHETDNAYLFNDGDQDYWIQKSQCQNLTQLGGSAGTHYDVTIPEWLAETKGIV